MNRPLVSVVLPCFNAERSVAAALDSLRNQTYDRLEILAVDDGSSDSTYDILEQHSAQDARIRVLRNERNLGLIATLNRGVAAAAGEVIARMDADDLAAKERLETQIAVLAEQPQVDVVGAAIEVVGTDDGSLRPRPVRCLGPGGARFMALLGTPLAHVTMVARAPVLKAYPYNESPGSVHTEDYELFARMLSAGVRFMNLPQALVTVRIDPRGVSLANEQLQISNFADRALDYFEQAVGYRPPRNVHRVLINRIDQSVTPHDLAAALHLLDEVEEMFLQREPEANSDIHRAADMQRVDILIQALRRRRRLRPSVGSLAVQYRHRLRSATSRQYIGSKLRVRRPASHPTVPAH